MISANAFAQDYLTLDSCYRLARMNYPLTRQKQLIVEYGMQEQAKLKKNYYPTIDVNVQYKYQSDVINISSESAAIPVPINITGEHNTYTTTLDARQLLWDGGATHLQRRASKINTQVKQQNLEIELHRLNEVVSQLYFNCILLNKQKDILEITKKNLETHLGKLKSSYANGITLKSNVDGMKAEVLLIRQKIRELEAQSFAQMKMLEGYIGIPLNENTLFEIPEININTSPDIQRAEMKAFKLNQEYLGVSSRILNVTRRPVIAAFGQAGYGKPGLNMLSDEFDSYYIVGLTLSWKLWDWNKTRHEKSMVSIHSDIIQTQIETFEQNIQQSAIQLTEEISRLTDLIALDKEIIELRSEVKKAASSQLENGVITSSEYISELNNETQARMNLEVHNIQLELAKVKLLQLYGQL